MRKRKQKANGTCLALAVATLVGFGAGCEGTQAVYVEHLAVININPSHGAVQIGYDTDVVVTLSEVLLAQTVNDASVCLTSSNAPPPNPEEPCVGTAPLAASVVYDPATLTIQLFPVDLLEPDQSYTLHLTREIRSENGGLPALITASFQTIPTN